MRFMEGGGQCVCVRAEPPALLRGPVAAPTQVHYLKWPLDLWCGLNHTLVLSQSGDFSKDLMGCGCGAGGRLPGWPKGSASFVRLQIKVRGPGRA